MIKKMQCNVWNFLRYINFSNHNIKKMRKKNIVNFNSHVIRIMFQNSEMIKIEIENYLLSKQNDNVSLPWTKIVSVYFLCV